MISRIANTWALGTWRRPDILLYLMAGAVPLSFATWQALLNNFAVEQVGFGGAEIGVLQSLREVPGFLAFAVVFLLLLFREQTLAYVSLALLGIGTAITGWYPTVIGLYCTTVLMSIGYHYYETVQISLSLQWVEKARAPETLGRIIAVGSFTSIVTFGVIWLAFDLFGLDFSSVYLLGGGVTCAVALLVWLAFPRFPEKVRQHRHLVLKKRYWLYYALTFMSGARRQIFIVFAGFLMVEKFEFSVVAITLLFLINSVANVIFAAKIGRLVARLGERRALVFEYAGLIIVFAAYAFVNHAGFAATLYVIDHLFFALAIAIKTYFQKIADPADIASSAGVGFTINHIAAVCLPAAFGLLWLVSPPAVFLSGAVMAGLSLLLSLNVPRDPTPGNEVVVNLPRYVTT
ncbi:MAG: MFS transporter [Gammaproteobacteria bacterium]|nr:MFS transporter [Gammaproteobacteria bacterium]